MLQTTVGIVLALAALYFIGWRWVLAAFGCVMALVLLVHLFPWPPTH